MCRPKVQRASTDTGRKRGAHSIILRELGWLQSHHEARRSDKRRRNSPERTQSQPSSAVAKEGAGARAAATALKAVALGPGDQLLAAIRNCSTHRPGSSGDADQRGATASAAAIALVDAQRQGRVELPPETLREALGASCRVGRLALVRAVLRLMEVAVPPYEHTSESLG